jgi:hypothetical protein
MRRMISGGLALATCIALGFVFAPNANAAPTTPNFTASIDGYPGYVGQSSCDPAAKPGVVGVRNLLNRTYGTHTAGISRACNVGAQSEHKEGRALDYHFNYFNTTDRAKAQDFINWLLATDRHGNRHAMVRRLGIMYVIWNRRIWKAYEASSGWQPYSGASPHTDHIHLSFSWAGARQRTSWWTYDPPRPDPMTGSGVSAIQTGSVLRVFVRAADDALWQNYWDGSRWTWQDLGGTITSAPSAVDFGGMLRVFARGADNALWQYYWDGSTWRTQDLGGVITSAPSAVVHGGVLRVFARGADNALWQYHLNDGSWSRQDLGGVLTSAPGAVLHGNALRVFARGADGALWQDYWDGTRWTWQDLGGQITSAPDAIVGGTVLRVFARGADNALWQYFWNDGSWSTQDLGGVITSGPGAVMYGSSLRVFARGADNALWQYTWTGSRWTTQDLGGSIH